MNDRLLYVDAMRGIAVVTVVIQHGLEHLVRWPLFLSSFPFAAVLVGDYFNLGRYGVVLFFLISGFVIPFSFSLRDGFLQHFLVRRFFRLYPLYWFSIAVAVFAIPVLEGTTVPLGKVLANLTMLQKGLGFGDVLGQYWSLFIEILFYACCVALAWVGVQRLLSRAWQAALVLLVISSVGYAARLVGIWFPDPSIPLHLGLMFWATCIRAEGLWPADTGGRVKILLPLMVALLAIVLLSLGHATGRLQNSRFVNGISILTPYIAALATFVFFLWIRKSSSILEYLGQISYSVYLMHSFPLMVGLHFFGQGSSWGEIAIFSAVTFLGAWLLSDLTYRLIEKPALEFGRFAERSIPRFRFPGKVKGRPV